MPTLTKHRWLWVFMFLLAAVATSLTAQTNWTGVLSTNWATAGNWSAGLPTPTSAVIIPSGTPNAPSTAGATRVVATLTVQPGAVLTVPAGSPLEITSSLTVDGQIVGTGIVRSTGSGTVTFSGSGPIAAVEAAGSGTLQFSGAVTIAGSVTLLSGGLRTFATTTISGQLLLSGGTMPSSNGLFDVNGNVVMSGGFTATQTANLRCAGNWTALAAFAPTSGTVTFDGVGAQSATGICNFSSAVIDPGAVVTASGPWSIGSDLTVSGSLAANGNSTTLAVGGILNVQGPLSLPGALDVNGDLTVTATGSITTGAFTSTFGDDVTLNGPLTGATSVVCDGSAFSIVSGTANFPTFVCGKTGTNIVRTTTPMNIVGGLSITGGMLQPGALMTVSGSATFTGGILGTNGGSIDIAGAAVWSGTTATTPANIFCAGNWTGASGFAPTQGTVTLDGGTPRTIGGATVEFYALVIAAGATRTTTSANLHCLSTLTINGSLNSGTTTLDIDGDLTMGSSASFQTGGGTHSFADDFTGAGTITGGGTFILDGNAFALLSSSAVLPNMTVAKIGTSICRTTGNVTLAGNFQLTSGHFQPGGGFNVVGNATLSGGTFGTNGGTFDLDGNAVWNGAIGTTPSNITCSGNWTADANFAPTQGTVTFDRSGAQTVGGTSPNFNALVVATGSVTTMTSPILHTNADCTIDGALTVGPTLDVDGSFTVGATGNVAFGAGTHTFGASFTCSGTVTGTGTLVFDGASFSFVTSTSTLPSFRVAKTGTSICRTSGAVACVGNFELLSGHFQPGGATTFTGNAVLSGGTFGTNGGSVDIAGSCLWNGAVATSPANIACGGNWTADAGFNPNSGTVTFDGTGTQTISGTVLEFNEIVVTAGATAVFGAVPMHAGAGLSVSGTLTTTAAAIDVDGTFSVFAGATWNAGSLTHLLGAGITIAGTLNSTGTIRADEPNFAQVAITPPIPSLIVAKTSGGIFRTSASLTVTGNFQLLSGNLQPSSTFRVDGSATFSGGMVGTNGGTFDLNGNVVLNGATGVSAASMTVAGNWSADANFVPSIGTVTFDGTGPQFLSSSNPSTSAIFFYDLALSNTTVRPAQNLTITIGSPPLVVAAGSTLDAAGFTLEIVSTTITVEGTLSAGAGGEIRLQPTTALTVASSGTLRLVGVDGNPARLNGAGAGGYSATINGTIAARFFEVRRPGANGLVIPIGATIAPSPNDLRRGLFDQPFSPTSVLLNVVRAQPTTFFGLSFANSNAVLARNVRTTVASAVLTFQNWSGQMAGPAFEDDPSTLINWAPTVNTELGFFAVTGCPAAVDIDWATIAEVGVQFFRIERATSIAGPYVVGATILPNGPGTYEYKDIGLVGGQQYFYRLVEQTPGGTNVLAFASTTTLPGTLPTELLTVGGLNGQYATIGAAVAAVTLPGSVIRVSSGTYPGFTLNAATPPGLRIISDGSGTVVVDTQTAPVVLDSLPFGSSCHIEGLTIGSATSANAGLVIVDCAATIFLNELIVVGGPGRAGCALDDSDYVAIQRSSLTGSPGLRTVGSSSLSVGRSTVDAYDFQGTTRAFLRDVTVGSTSAAPGTTITTYAPGMPEITMPTIGSCNDPITFDIQTEPLTPWFSALSIAMQWFEPTSPVIEMTSLVTPQTGGAIFDSGFTDVVGHDFRQYIVPAIPALYGRSLVYQALTYDIASGAYRLSTARVVLILPISPP